MHDCPDPQLLDEFSSGRLSMQDRARVEQHLDSCSDCARTIAELARLYGSRSVGARSAPPAAFSSTPPPAEGAVGRYRIGGKLGEGGMGAVFAAFDPELHRKVALKLLHPDASAGAEELRIRLMLEAQAMAKLAHPNVVTVFDVGRFGDQLFVAMELVEGTTLRDFLATRRSMASIVDVFVQAGRGLAAAHHQGLVHRDFKPDNVLLGKDGRARVTDFGLSRPMAIPWSQVPVDVMGPTRPHAMTVSGMLIGTPAYMAPEQLRGQVADARSDQFAFGVALFEAVVGARPFDGETLRELASNVTAGRLRPFLRSTPRWLKALLVRALAVRPEDRYPSMDALLAELSRDHGQLRRIALATGGMLAGASAIVAVLHFATKDGRPTTVPPVLGSATAQAAAAMPGGVVAVCSAGADLVDGSWNADKRAAMLRSRLMKGDQEATKRYAKRMDDYVAAWKTTKQGHCAKEPTDTPFNACMTSTARDLDALTAMIKPDDTHLVARGLEASYRLREPSDCDKPDVAALYPIVTAGKASIAMADAARVLAAVELDERFEVDAPVASLKADVATLDPSSKPYVLYALGVHEAAYRTYEPAIQHLTQAAELARESHDVLTEAKSATALGELLGAVLLDPPAAEKWLRVAEDATKGNDSLGRLHARALEARARALVAWEFPFKAKAVFERALAALLKTAGENDPAVARLRAHHARTLTVLEAWPDAIATADLAVKSAIGSIGELHPTTSWLYAVLAEADVEGLKLEDADRALEKADVSQKGFLNLGDVDEALRFDAAGRAAEYRNDFDAAEKAYRRALQKRKAAIVSDHPDTAISYAHLSEVEEKRGHKKEAVDLRREELAVLERFYGESDPHLWRALRDLAMVLEEQEGDADAATKQLERAAGLVRARFGEASPIFGFLSHRNGLMLAHLGRFKEAIVDLETAFSSLQMAYDGNQPLLSFLVILRGQIYCKLGDKVTGVPMMDAGLHTLRERLGAENSTVKEMEKTVASLR